MQAFVILSSSLVATFLLTLLPGLRPFRQALAARGGLVLIPVLAFTVTFLGSSTGADLRADIPDPLRLVRMIVIMVLFLFAIFMILRQLGLAFGRAGGGARWMLLYAAIAMSSAVWSVGPALSLWKGFEVLTFVLLAMTVAIRLRTLEDLEWLHRVMAMVLLFLCITVVMGLIFYPGDAIKDTSGLYGETARYFAVRGRVPALNPSLAGTLGALVAVMAVAALLQADTAGRTRRTGIWAMFGVGVLVALLAHSRTSIFAGTAAILIQLVYARRWRLIGVAAVAGILLVAVTTLGEVVLKYIYRGQDIEKFTTMTGRLDSWVAFWDEFMGSPIIGYGYYSAQRLMFGTSSVDNSHLEVLLGLGIGGYSLFFMAILWAGVRLYAGRLRNGPITLRNYLWLSTAGIFAAVLIRSLTGASFQVMHPLLVVYLIMQISVAALVRAHVSDIPKSADTASRRQFPGTPGRRQQSVHPRGGIRAAASPYPGFKK